MLFTFSFITPGPFIAICAALAQTKDEYHLTFAVIIKRPLVRADDNKYTTTMYEWTTLRRIRCWTDVLTYTQSEHAKRVPKLPHGCSYLVNHHPSAITHHSSLLSCGLSGSNSPDILVNVSSICSRTLSVRAVTSSAVRPSVDTGGMHSTITFPETKQTSLVSSRHPSVSGDNGLCRVCQL